MSPGEARERIGQKVVYRPPGVRHDEPGEEGVITSVNNYGMVFVRYGSNVFSQATYPSDLEPISGAAQ